MRACVINPARMRKKDEVVSRDSAIMAKRIKGGECRHRIRNKLVPLHHWEHSTCQRLHFLPHSFPLLIPDFFFWLWMQQEETPSPSSSPRNTIEMKRKTKAGKQYTHLRDDQDVAVSDTTNRIEREKGEKIEDTRWHEGHPHGEECEHEQHFHHLTFPSSLADIETDDAEFVDPTESIFSFLPPLFLNLFSLLPSLLSISPLPLLLTPL